MERAARGGFNINGRNNGILLDPAVHQATQFHPWHSNAVRKKLDRMLNEMGGKTDTEVTNSLQLYTDRIKGSLSKLPSGKGLNWFMIEWKILAMKDPRKRRIRGETDATSEVELVSAFAEMWILLFRDQLPFCAEFRWNCILGAMQLWHGNIALSPCMDFETTKQLPGCELYCRRLHADYECINDDSDGDVFLNNLSKVVSRSLIKALDVAKRTESVRTILSARSGLGFRLFAELDEPSVIDIIVEAD